MGARRVVVVVLAPPARETDAHEVARFLRPQLRPTVPPRTVPTVTTLFAYQVLGHRVIRPGGGW